MNQPQRRWEQLRGRWRTPPPVTDALLALLVLAVTLYGAVGEAHPGNPADQLAGGLPVPVPPDQAYLLVVLAALVLALRRRFPLSVLAISTGAALWYTALGYVSGSVALTPLVALYTVIVVRRSVRDALLLGFALAVLFFEVGAVWGPYGTLGGGQTVNPWVTAAVVGLALAVVNRRQYVREIQDRAEEAESARDYEAARRVDAERLRIARELHDVVAHTMSTINVQAAVGAHLIADHPDQAAEALRVIKAASKDGLRELRAILDVLRAVDQPESTAPTSGLAHLDTLLEGTRRAGLPVSLTAIGQPQTLPAAVDLAAFRIVQESLTNTVRHAGPATASVSVNYLPGELRLEITDTGRASTAQHTGAGHGIRGMTERATALDGSLQAGATADGGFRVLARLPFAPSS